MDVRFCARQEPLPRGIECALRVLQALFWALSRAPQEDHCFLLTKTYMDVGIPILLGTGRSPGRTFIQIEGSGYRIKPDVLKKEFERPGELRRHLQHYMQAFLVQTAQTAACNRLHGIEQRLARWLATCRDRMESDRLVLTHEFLGQMLGAPRTTVTLAAGILQRAGLIDYRRGVVTVQNRSALERVACECYRIVRNEFTRLKLL